MKKASLLLYCAIFMFLNACKDKAASNDDSFSGSELKDSTLITPLLEAFAKNIVDSSTVGIKSMADPTCTLPTTRENLSGLRTVIKMFNGKTNAGISVPGFGGLTLGEEEVSYSVYYVEPKIVTCNGEQKVYGIGYSLHLLIKKLKRGLDVSKIPSIAASVQLENNKTQVFYSLQSYGLAGIPIVKFFKPVVNKPFDVDGFGIMQASIDGIHEFLSDSTLSSHLRIAPTELKFVMPGDIQ